MTTTTSRAASPSAELGPGARGVARSARLPLLALVLLVLLVLVAVAVGGRRSSDALARDSFSQQGGRAVAQLVAARGVDVVDDLPGGFANGDGAGTVVFVPLVSRVGSGDLMRVLDGVRRGATAVVAVDAQDDLDRLGVTADADSPPGTTLQPGCDDAAAVNAGAANIGRAAVLAVQGGDVPSGFTSSVVTCYRSKGTGTPSAGAMVVLTSQGGGRLVLLGDTSFLENRYLSDEGDAALGVGLLSPTGTQTLVWLYPAVGAAGTDGAGAEQRSLTSLVSSSWLLGGLGLAAAVVLLGIARSRRLGPVVSEELPVVVRSVENVQARARLYRARGARDRAGATLRQAARGRLAARLGLGPDTTPAVLVTTVAVRAGLPESDVGTLLYARNPATDADLVDLAHDLDELVARALQPSAFPPPSPTSAPPVDTLKPGASS